MQYKAINIESPFDGELISSSPSVMIGIRNSCLAMGKWSLVGRPNLLEMMVIRLALKKAIKYMHHSCVMISTGNTAGVSYINKQGGTYSPNLCVEVWEILHWCLEHDIVTRIRHIPGKFNILADRLSRLDRPLKTEWALDQSVANFIFQMLNYPNVDLFATRFNHKLPLYVSPVPDSHALAIDALSMNMSLAKIRQSRCRIVFFPTSVVFRGVTTISISSNLSSALSKTTDTVKRKVSTSKSPITRSSRLGVIKQSIRDKKFSQNVVDFVSKSRRTSTQKDYDQNGSVS